MSDYKNLIAVAGYSLCQEVLLHLQPGDLVEGGGQEGGEKKEQE